MNSILYIAAGTEKEFLDYQKEHLEEECYRIIDSNTLRGRQVGRIIRIGTYNDLWNIQEIEESIDTHEQLWNTQIVTDQIDENDENLLSYGI